MSLSNWISKHAAFTPQKPALIYEAGEISYAELHQRIEACALELRERFRIQEGDRVAFLGLNSPQFLVLLFACARLKAIFLPLNWRLAAPEHQYILEDAAPKLCICEQEFDAHVLSLKNAVPDCHFIAADFDNPNWERMQFQPILNQPALEANEEGSDQTPLLLVYTSGTTGRPKGAVLTQGAIQWNALNSLHMHGLTSQDIILTVLPMFHVGGLNIQTTPALYCGATVILHRRFDPAATLAAFQNQKPTLTVLVPATISALLAHPSWATSDTTSLRSVTTGSSVVPEKLIDAFHDKGVPVLQVYGSTETCPIAIYQVKEDAFDHVGSTGKPALHCEAQIVDDNGNQLGPNQSGEILVKGPSLMSCYWGNEEATAECLQDGWFHTGDVGYFNDDGFFYVNDRKKDLIISGGENIYPAELELVLNELPGISQAAVVGRDDPRWGQVPVAVISLKPDASISEDEIHAHFDNRLARFKHPKDILFLDHLPANAMGKVQKFALRAMLEQGLNQ